jgi:hypothetical protein
VLKNAMDWTLVEWHRKPVAFVGWGNVGGARAIEQLRQVAVELGMPPLRRAVHILPEVLIAARSAEGGDTSAFAPLEPRLKLLGSGPPGSGTRGASGRHDRPITTDAGGRPMERRGTERR